jgi:hypothetical protein
MITRKKLEELSLICELQESMVMYQAEDYFWVPVATEDEIVKTIADYFGISVDLIKSNRRETLIKNARFFAMYFLSRLTEMSCIDNGNYFNGRDHTTALHAIEFLEDKFIMNDSNYFIRQHVALCGLLRINIDDDLATVFYSVEKRRKRRRTQKLKAA